MSAYMLTGHTVFKPTWLSFMARAYADNGQFKDAWRCIDEAISTIDTTKERWFEAEVNRIAGEIALLSPNTTLRKLKPISSARLRSRASSKQSPGNSAPP
jgi:hypothetical protein